MLELWLGTKIFTFIAKRGGAYVLYGAPLRLRCENEVGFKMVKWIEAIEFVESFDHLGAGQGGFREDHEFLGYRQPI